MLKISPRLDAILSAHASGAVFWERFYDWHGVEAAAMVQGVSSPGGSAGRDRKDC